VLSRRVIGRERSSAVADFTSRCRSRSSARPGRFAWGDQRRRPGLYQCLRTYEHRHQHSLVCKWTPGEHEYGSTPTATRWQRPTRGACWPPHVPPSYMPTRSGRRQMPVRWIPPCGIGAGNGNSWMCAERRAAVDDADRSACGSHRRSWPRGRHLDW